MDSLLKKASSVL